jgi:H+/gluconate symporter-like permease
MSTPQRHSGRFQPSTQSVTVEQPQLDVAMTDRHYKRVQERVRKEIKGTHTASIWIALALAAFGVMTTLIVTAAFTEITSATEKGKLETSAWAAVIVVVIFVVVHLVTRKDGDVQANDVIAEMDTYCYRALAAPVESGEANDT